MSLVRPALVMLVLFSLLTGIAYPLLLTGAAQLVFPTQANGSLLRNGEGAVIGSSLIAQGFAEAKYFQPRPSNAGEKGYDAALSGASNLGPANAKLKEAVETRVKALELPTGQTAPADLVTASGSGLDPHISPHAARLQAGRVAKARNLPEEQVRTLIDRYVEARQLGILGEPRVNVLRLNLALDGK